MNVIGIGIQTKKNEDMIVILKQGVIADALDKL
jgi:hypothetical protein